LPDITREALDALVAANDPTRVFAYSGALSRLRTTDSGRLAIETLCYNGLRGEMARSAVWLHARYTKTGALVLDDCPPQMDVVKDLAHQCDWPGLPVLRRLIEAPVFAADGTLVDSEGYHAGSGIWYQPAPGLVVPAVPARPTRQDIKRAKYLLRTELMGDFPFVDDASVAHALAAVLLPFVRDLIDGPTPLHLYGAPTEGSGKGLLVDVTTLVSTGRPAEAVAEARDNDEWRKRLTAALVEGSPFVFIDNLNRVLDSSALASALTARAVKDRILGQTKTVVVPVQCVWVASGNNPKLSRELIRRTVSVRIDAKMDRPWQRAECLSSGRRGYHEWG
jgi:hypothetical protein